jgi:transposase InsO family protein
MLVAEDILRGVEEENKGFVIQIHRRGKPTDNATVESFNGRFREECLNAHWFESVEDAKQKIDAWRWDYNCVSYYPTFLCA